MTYAQDLLAPAVVGFWIVALVCVLLHQSRKLVAAKGEHWWHHGAHFIMLVAMIGMYAAMAGSKAWFPRHIWMLVYSAITLAVGAWLVVLYRRHASVSKMWALAWVSQVAMLYMCAPPRRWLPLASYAFALYFAWECLGWLRRTHRREAVDPNAAPWRKVDIDALAMTIMAASMAYMFVGMQLRASEKQLDAAPAQRQEEINGPPNPSPVPDERPSTVSQAATLPPQQTRSYKVVAGDTFYRIAERLYGDPRRWVDISKANAGADPRRLRAGQTINLPP